MEAGTFYRVCPHRNVPAAFACFLGPDARGVDRFFDPGAIEDLACRLHNVMDAGGELVAGSVDVAQHALVNCWLIAYWGARDLLHIPDLEPVFSSATLRGRSPN